MGSEVLNDDLLGGNAVSNSGVAAEVSKFREFASISMCRFSLVLIKLSLFQGVKGGYLLYFKFMLKFLLMFQRFYFYFI